MLHRACPALLCLLAAMPSLCLIMLPLPFLLHSPALPGCSCLTTPTSTSNESFSSLLPTKAEHQELTAILYDYSDWTPNEELRRVTLPLRELQPLREQEVLLEMRSGGEWPSGGEIVGIRYGDH